jgi:hypothetical protein
MSFNVALGIYLLMWAMCSFAIRDMSTNEKECKTIPHSVCLFLGSLWFLMVPALAFIIVRGKSDGN